MPSYEKFHWRGFRTAVEHLGEISKGSNDSPHFNRSVELGGKTAGTAARGISHSVSSGNKSASENGVAATAIANSNDFIRFGVTDTAITLLSPRSYLVLTTDFPLSGLLAKRGVDVVNFNHLRLGA